MSNNTTLHLSDPFLIKYLKIPGGKSKPHAIGWQAEAFRRLVGHHKELGASFPELLEPDFQTWMWSPEMALELYEMPISGDLSKGRIDPDKPGIGIHVFPELAPIAEVLFAKKKKKNILVPENMLFEGKHQGFDAAHLLRLVCIRRDGTTRSMSFAAGHIRHGSKFSSDLPWHNNSRGWQPNVFDDNPLITEFGIMMQCLLSSRAMEYESVETAVSVKKHRGTTFKGIDESVRVNKIKWRKAPQETRESRRARAMGKDKHWWVAGHIRMQPYPSKGTVEAKYIEPHIKGNIEAPLHRVPTVNMVIN